MSVSPDCHWNFYETIQSTSVTIATQRRISVPLWGCSTLPWESVSPMRWGWLRGPGLNRRIPCKGFRFNRPGLYIIWATSQYNRSSFRAVSFVKESDKLRRTRTQRLPLLRKASPGYNTTWWDCSEFVPRTRSRIRLRQELEVRLR